LNPVLSPQREAFRESIKSTNIGHPQTHGCTPHPLPVTLCIDVYCVSLPFRMSSQWRLGLVYFSHCSIPSTYDLSE
jgi:hypothetical protein